MPKQLSHEEIAQRFVDAKVIDFDAMGRLIAELGPTLAVSDQGWHGFNFGRFNSLACMMPAADVARLVGNLHGAALTAAVLEGAIDSALPR
ncbi:MAG: hypothetical protein M3N82_00900 [Pseudomonadota bacterium]|nr:hypothetical protein [Pseudomonadota bacterium]